jgi:Helix-turn-helix domain
MPDRPEHFREEISTVAAAERYSLTPSYVARLARTHIIRARKFGRDWIVDEEALREYLARPRKPGPKPQARETVETNQGHVLNGSEEVIGEHHAIPEGSGNGKTVSE